MQDASDALKKMGIYVLFGGSREALARELVAEGVTMKDLHNFETYMNDTIKDPQMRVALAAKRLKDPEGRTKMWQDIKDHLELNKAKFEDGGPSHYWGFPSPHPSCKCKGCEERRAAGFAEVR